MSLGARIGAGAFAPVAAAGGAVAPLNDNASAPIHHDTPAIYQEAPEGAEPRSLEDVASNHSGDGFTVNVPEEFRESQPASLQEPIEAQESEPSTAQKIGKLGEGVEDIGDGLAEAGRAKDRAEENEEQNNALNEPVPSQEPPPKSEPASEQESSPSNDGGYDYSGYGY